MPNRTLQSFLLRDLPQLQVGVIGDCMLDRYIFGDVSRISPESPRCRVLIFLVVCK